MKAEKKPISGQAPTSARLNGQLPEQAVTILFPAQPPKPNKQAYICVLFRKSILTTPNLLMKSCSILGCGWLGFPLAKYLITRGFNIKGATTQEEKMGELQRSGIRPYQILLSETGITGNIEGLLESECLILNIPPGRRDPEVTETFPAKINLLLDALAHSPVRYVLFVSSTSVYGDISGPVNEDTPLAAKSGSGQALILAEQMLTTIRPEVTILRLSGLIGEDRHPGRFLAGRSDVPNPGHPVNLIHRTDCIQLIYEIIRQEKWGTVFNASADEHPSKSSFYTKAAIRMGLRPPVFTSHNEGAGKLITNDRIKAELAYTFRYPDPEKMA